MPRKNNNLVSSVAVTPEALSLLTRTSELTGMTRGKLASLAIERAYSEKNPSFVKAREQFTQTVLGRA